jgi:hypothetical protein
MTSNFQSDFHALKCGMVIGALMKAGIPAYPETDDNGDYTNIIHMRLDMGDPQPVDVDIEVLP